MYKETDWIPSSGARDPSMPKVPLQEPLAVQAPPRDARPLERGLQLEVHEKRVVLQTLVPSPITLLAISRIEGGIKT